MDKGAYVGPGAAVYDNAKVYALVSDYKMSDVDARAVVQAVRKILPRKKS